MLMNPKWERTQRTDTANTLSNAAEILEIKGWCQSDAVDASGAYCAISAIYMAAAMDNDVRAYAEAMYAFANHIGYCSISLWNDMPGRTKDEVINALRDAANE